MCKLIIAGSRSIKDYQILRTAIIKSGLWTVHGKKIVVISGKAPGVDTLGEEFAAKAGLKVIAKPAKWDNVKAKGAVVRHNARGAYNALAGHWRNEEMAQEADAALIVWDGGSTGSLDMLHRMIDLEKPAYLYALRMPVDLWAQLDNTSCEIIYPERLDIET